LGITVDDTIHLFHGFRRRMQAGASVVFAVSRSFEASGRAVLATSMILISQFAMFASSDFVPTANFGLMTAAGLAAGLGFELLLLPALLLLWYGRGTAATSRKRQLTSGVRAKRRRLSRSADSEFAPTQLLAPHAVNQLVGRPKATACAGLHVLLCQGATCREKGASSVWKRLRHIQRTPSFPGMRLTRASCLGRCELAPMVHIYPRDRVAGPLTPENVEAQVAAVAARATD
jgi:(2Fe-2S) ferredoxin